ncbi:MAG: HAMP domain-containing protein [Chitinophagaceae bacterium]|nr:HAMP domain-containing protein [Chitinophagaceae bacterium]
MAIKLKTKVALGGVFLFALLITVGALSVYYLNRITEEAKGIVKDNYETLNYSREMLKEMDELSGADSMNAFKGFEQSLRLQERNITEPGEKEFTESLRKNFNSLKQIRTTDSLRSLIRKDISGIMQLNLKAIDRKNQVAKASAENAKTIITVILTLCTLIGLTFVFNFPSLVASPIAKLTEGIKAIASKNYGERIHLNRKDEFGQLANAFNSMAEKLDEYEHSNLAKILFEKRRAETVINSLKDASIGIDNKGIILFANQQALQLLNLRELEIVGQPQEGVQRKNDLFRFLLNEKNNAPFKIVVEGKENYFTKEIIDIKQEEDKAGSVIVLRNITSFKELDVAKTNFIATISHELKTPLASSDFSLKLLEDSRVGLLTNEQKELVQQLRNDNQRMLKILSELLNMSQVEAGKIQLDIQEVSPYSIVQTSIKAVSGAAKEKQITIDLRGGDDLPDIKTDPDKISWVLNNFLTNAIKFSPAGSSIIIAVQKKDNEMSFSVADEGIGIEKTYQSRIFERYFQVPGRSEKKGSGIGLAICKEFIDALGGKIWVRSELGQGSRFGFDIPVSQ